MKRFTVVVVALCLCVGPAAALDLKLLGETGVMLPQGDLSDLYKTGVVFGGGVHAGLAPMIGARAEVLYSSMSPEVEVPGVEISSSTMPIIGSAVLSVPMGIGLKMNLLGGLGMYRSSVTLGPLSASSTDFGYSGGLELDITMVPKLDLGGQVRYHLVPGDVEDSKYLSALLVLKYAL